MRSHRVVAPDAGALTQVVLLSANRVREGARIGVQDRREAHAGKGRLVVERAHHGLRVFCQSGEGLVLGQGVRTCRKHFRLEQPSVEYLVLSCGLGSESVVDP